MKILIALLLISLAQNAIAETVTLDFDDLTSPLEQDLARYSSDGYKITSSVNASNAFLAWGSTSTFYSGSAALAAANFNALITLSRADNAIFDFTSIDVETLFTRQNGFNSLIAPADITFTGVKSDNSLVTQTISISPVTAISELTTFAILGFDDITSVYWAQGGFIPATPFDINQRHQFDNIVVSTNDVNAVPVPAAAWLFGSSLIGFAGLRRKFKV
ncbi:MAG: hypothetical protein BVN34_06865 [Proteobacteria bacterium ST_bin12]|nr:MAG: hypothetical protein BVN34_06865 [Proteobacteria bacterium ST_bin12]